MRQLPCPAVCTWLHFIHPSIHPFFHFTYPSIQYTYLLHISCAWGGIEKDSEKLGEKVWGVSFISDLFAASVSTLVMAPSMQLYTVLRVQPWTESQKQGSAEGRCGTREKRATLPIVEVWHVYLQSLLAIGPYSCIPLQKQTMEANKKHSSNLSNFDKIYFRKFRNYRGTKK